MLLPYLHKKQLKVSLVASHDKIFLIFKFGQRRTKMLKGKRTFYARVFTGEVSVAQTLNALRNWLESVTGDYILERLEDAPLKHRPVIDVTPKVRLDFNVTEEDVTALL